MSTPTMRLCSALVLCLVALAGCGDGDKPASTAGAGSPQELLGAVEAALRDVESFHIEGTMTDEDGETRLEGDVGHGAVHLSVDKDGATARMIVLGEDEVYIRGDQAFWKQSDAPAGALELLTDRWARIPPDEEFTELSEHLQPDFLAQCLDEGLGTLSVRQGSLEGKPVVLLVDAGDKPGTAPGEISVAPSDPQLPLRIRQTGPSRPGGSPPSPACSTSTEEEDDDAATTGVDLRLSRWDEPVEIEAPPNALDLEQLAREARGESTV